MTRYDDLPRPPGQSRLPCWQTIIIAAVVTACGGHQAQRAPSRPPAILPPSITPHPPATYPLQDPTCGASDSALTSTTIYGWDFGQVRAFNAELRSVTSQASLHSPAVSQTTFGDAYERTCDSGSPGLNCLGADQAEKAWVLSSAPNLLQVCKNGFAYGRTSGEGIALASIFYLQKARETYERLAVKVGAQPPAPIELAVMPQFIDYYPNYLPPKDGVTQTLKLFLTHNLAYFSGQGMIAVFPERAEQAGRQPGFFWESAFVLAHEYGHHIDFTRHGQLLNGHGLYWDGAAHAYLDQEARTSKDGAPPPRAQIAGALAEGFADLLAYYADGATPRSLLGVPDIGINRDVGNPRFKDGSAKILDDSVLGVLLGLYSESSGGQEAPRLKDIHTGGAILAHAIDSAFLALTPNMTYDHAVEPLSADRRYGLALEFMDEVTVDLVAATANGGAPLSAGQYLAPIGRALEKVATHFLTSAALTNTKAAEAIQSAFCQQVERLLPALAEPPFGSQHGCPVIHLTMEEATGS